MLYFLFFILFSFNVSASSSIALGYEPKYADNFSHFDYVNPNAVKKGKVILSAFGSFDSLNPYLLKGSSADGLGELMFETLMEKSWDEPFSMYGLLAKTIKLAEDKLSVTFILDENATFSDGSPVTAQDVKFSFDTLMSDKAHPLYGIYWADVERAEVIDDSTITFYFKQKNAELHLIIGELPVFSKAWIGDKDFDEVVMTMPIASGPYIISDYQAGRYIRYQYNENYWAKDKNIRQGMFNFKAIEFKYYKDLTVTFEAFKAGEFDFILENNSKRWARDHQGGPYQSGEIIKTEFKHERNAGMQGFVFNLRNPLFQDQRVREAINLAYDFKWANEKLFYNQYTRCDSFFSNSELAAPLQPSAEELALLQPWKDMLDPAVFNTKWQPAYYENHRELRKGLREAKKLLEQAGWKVKNGILQNAKGDVFEFEITLALKGFERIVAPFADNLKKLGIKVNYRTVDTALYLNKLDNFDFDMIVMSYAQSESPGNEQFNYFHSSSKNQVGSRNYMGLEHAVVDALVEKLVTVETRAELVTITHALDRILLQGNYVIPNWYIDTHRVAYWDKFIYAETKPLYYGATEWMLKTWSYAE